MCLGAVSECATPAEVNKHLDLGRDFLARGQLSDALTHYHAAVGECPPAVGTYCCLIAPLKWNAFTRSRLNVTMPVNQLYICRQTMKLLQLFSVYILAAR